MLTTRLSNSIRKFRLRSFHYISSVKEFIPTNLICLLAGFYIGGNLAPIMGLLIINIQSINQSLFCFFFVFIFELISKRLTDISIKKPVNLETIFLLHCRNVKQGILFGIFVDAFKVGS